jgi:hypothetical protein
MRHPFYGILKGVDQKREKINVDGYFENYHHIPYCVVQDII